MHRQPRHEDEAGPLDKLGLPPAPGVRLFDRERRAVKQNTATSIRDGPVIAVANPSFHLTSPDRLRLINQRGDDPRLVHSARPQLQRERVIAPMRPRDLAQDRRPDAQQLDARGNTRRF